MTGNLANAYQETIHAQTALMNLQQHLDDDDATAAHWLAVSESIGRAALICQQARSEWSVNQLRQASPGFAGGSGQPRVAMPATDPVSPLSVPADGQL